MNENLQCFPHGDDDSGPLFFPLSNHNEFFNYGVVLKCNKFFIGIFFFFVTFCLNQDFEPGIGNGYVESARQRDFDFIKT